MTGGTGFRSLQRTNTLVLAKVLIAGYIAETARMARCRLQHQSLSSDWPLDGGKEYHHHFSPLSPSAVFWDAANDRQANPLGVFLLIFFCLLLILPPCTVPAKLSMQSLMVLRCAQLTSLSSLACGQRESLGPAHCRILFCSSSAAGLVSRRYEGFFYNTY